MAKMDKCMRMPFKSFNRKRTKMKKLTKIDLGFFAWLCIVLTIAILTSSCVTAKRSYNPVKPKRQSVQTCETYK